MLWPHFRRGSTCALQACQSWVPPLPEKLCFPPFILRNPGPRGCNLPTKYLTAINPERHTKILPVNYNPAKRLLDRSLHFGPRQDLHPSDDFWSMGRRVGQFIPNGEGQLRAVLTWAHFQQQTPQAGGGPRIDGT